jgi:RNA polymerase sigma-54 factor
MAMLPGLQINVSQQLKLTPQLQQSINILQFSAFELQQAIEDALDSNIMLEREEDQPTDLAEADTQAYTETVSDSDEWTSSSLLDFNASNESIDHSGQLTETLDCQWDDLFDSDHTASDNISEEHGDFTISSHHDDDDYTSAENYTAATEDLYNHLKWQVDTFNFANKQAQIIAYYVIDAINEQGYFASTLDEIAHDVTEHEAFTCQPQHVSDVLTIIQQNFDPAGIGARDIQECLLIQLHAMMPQTALIEIASQMLTERFDWFAHGDFTRLKRIYGLDDEAWHALIALIQSCSPKPGLKFANTEREIIVPDLIIKRDKKGWKIELNAQAYPRVRINSEYVDLLKKIDKSKRNSDQIEQMKENLIEAKSLLKSIQSRGETLLKVASYIIKEQAKFLEEGEVAMKPMVLRDVADALSLHESTISRATTQKYIQTPRGTFELKYFFSSSVSQYGPQDQSAVAIKARIKQLIDAEDPRKPISDQDLVEKLQGIKINVARRTVAKYREALGIGSSSQRKVRR